MVVREQLMNTPLFRQLRSWHQFWQKASLFRKSRHTRKKERQADVYGHQAFLMSFVPVLNSMPLHVAVEARLKITEIINASLHRSCMNLSTSTGHHSASAGWPTSGCKRLLHQHQHGFQLWEFQQNRLHPVTECSSKQLIFSFYDVKVIT
jgi:hypothetical protein